MDRRGRRVAEPDDLALPQSQDLFVLVGGSNDGMVYRGVRCKELELPERTPQDRTYRPGGLPPDLYVTVERYFLSRVRMGAWDTDFWYYHHESMDEQSGSLALFGKLWANMLKVSRQKDPNQRTCPLCEGEGVITE